MHDSKSLSENSLCEIHHLRLKNTLLPILYGKFSLDNEYEVDKSQFFPKANEGSVKGGCIIEESSPREKIELVCDRCTEIRQEWLKRNHTS